jgi:hypothetical protein
MFVPTIASSILLHNRQCMAAPHEVRFFGIFWQCKTSCLSITLWLIGGKSWARDSSEFAHSARRAEATVGAL